MKYFYLHIIFLTCLCSVCHGAQAVVFVQPGYSITDWPDCVQKVRKIPGSDMVRIQYLPETGCIAVLQQMAAVVHVEKDRYMLIPDSLGQIDADRPFCTPPADLDVLSTLGLGKGVTAAIIDTGVSVSVFGGFFAQNSGEIPGDGIDNDNNGYVDDVYGWNFGEMNADVNDVLGHGTQVASVFLTAAPQAQIVPLRVTAGMDDGFSTGDAAEAIYYAASRGVDVINMSFSAAQFSYAIAAAVIHAADQGILLVGASGNDGNTVQFPANMVDVIAVGSHDANDDPSWFSPFGIELDILGPGQDACAVGADGQDVVVSGTSFSTPAVAGSAAVLQSMNPHLTVASLKKLLFAGTRDILDPGFDLYSGYGLLDADKLAAAATPEVVVPKQIKKGSFLEIDIRLPPTDVKTHVYLALVHNTVTWWMDGTGSWFNAADLPYAPFTILTASDFTFVPVFGTGTVLGLVDTSAHVPGKYLWGTAIFDNNGNMLAPIGWAQMALY